MTSLNSTQKTEISQLKQRIQILEIENDHLKSKLRERESEIDDLHNFYQKTLEELAITGSELDALKNHSQENTQRMRDYITELTQELEIVRKHQKIAAERQMYQTQSMQNEFKYRFDVKLHGKEASEMIDVLISSLNINITEYKKQHKLNRIVV